MINIEDGTLQEEENAIEVLKPIAYILHVCLLT
jgi:hypothetical protein